MNDKIKPVRPGVLSLTIKDKNALYASYMPYVKGGGIFVPSTKAYKLGDVGHATWRPGQSRRRRWYPVQ
jgi:type IV pilus assembly protein PilZ